MNNTKPFVLLLGMLLLFLPSLNTQGQDPFIFSSVEDSTVTARGGTSGAAWVDYDGDGDLDMFTVGQGRRHLFRNDDNVLVEVTDNLLTTDQTIGSTMGVAWADYDADGDLDVLVAGVPMKLYINDGTGTFSHASGAGLDEDNRGWSPSWADADNDGDLDIFLTHPAGFVRGGGRTPNIFLLNDGPPNYTFTKVTDYLPTQVQAAYTDANWSDFDDDGDLDLFVGGAGNGALKRDYFYLNTLVENGELGFERLEGISFADDTRDGQTPNFIDYDNDGDLDFYITNWGGTLGGIANDLYLNDGGNYIKISEQLIATEIDLSLGNVWGDVDNDGDQDVYVTNGNRSGGSTQNRLYLNNGDATFTKVTQGAAVEDNIITWGSSLGDYDDDGDLDLFVSGQQGRHRLYRNDSDNGNSWIRINLVGTASNRTGVGAKVFATAIINGVTVTQRREVSTQNSYLGHNSLTVHFGFGDATELETLIIQWPSGQVDEFSALSLNQTLIATEGQGVQPLD